MEGAQAELGVIPKEAADDIQTSCDASKLDMDRLRQETEIVGYPILPLIRQLDAMCANNSGRYLHWGATTQDVRTQSTTLIVDHGPSCHPPDASWTGHH